jgi:hypothetical protein
MPSKEIVKLLIAGNSFIFRERMLDVIFQSKFLRKYPFFKGKSPYIGYLKFAT